MHIERSRSSYSGPIFASETSPASRRLTLCWPNPRRASLISSSRTRKNAILQASTASRWRLSAHLTSWLPPHRRRPLFLRYQKDSRGVSCRAAHARALLRRGRQIVALSDEATEPISWQRSHTRRVLKKFAHS